MDYLLLAVSFAVILAGALFFTNAVEWAGHRLGLGEGATGSLLAAVGTAMPETLIPIVAIIGGAEGSEDVAVGAIIGAPFLLATIAMALVGISALLYKRPARAGHGAAADAETLDRDLLFFLVFFALGIVARASARRTACSPARVVFVLAYGVYVRKTLRGGRRGPGGRHDRPAVHGPDARATTRRRRPIVLQLVVGLAAIVGGAHLFVEELITSPRSSGSSRWSSRWCSRRSRPSCRRRRTASSGSARARTPGAGQHHRGDGLPVDDPDRGRPRLHRVGPRQVRRRLGRRSAWSGGVLAYWALRLRSRFERAAVVDLVGPVRRRSSSTWRWPEPGSSSASAASTTSSCVFGETLGKTFAIFPSGR